MKKRSVSIDLLESATGALVDDPSVCVWHGKSITQAKVNTVHLRNCRVFCLAGGQNIAMARTLASLPTGSRVTDYISLGVVSRAIPREKIDSILASTGKASVRQRELPAHLVVYYVIALALYMQSSYREVLRCLLEGIQWLTKPEETVRATGKSGISQARSLRRRRAGRGIEPGD